MMTKPDSFPLFDFLLKKDVASAQWQDCVRLEETGGGKEDTFDFTLSTLPRDSCQQLLVTVMESTYPFFTADQKHSYLLKEKKIFGSITLWSDDKFLLKVRKSCSNDIRECQYPEKIVITWVS